MATKVETKDGVNPIVTSAKKLVTTARLALMSTRLEGRKWDLLRIGEERDFQTQDDKELAIDACIYVAGLIARVEA